MRIRPVWAKLLHASNGPTDGETDMERLIDALRNLVKEPKTQSTD